MEPSREDIRQWLLSALDKTGESASGLAKRAGLATTTLTRFLNEEGSPMLTLRSIAKVAHAAGIFPIGVPAPTPVQQPRGLADGEATPYTDVDNAALDSAIEAITQGRTAADPWQLLSSSLEGAGYMRGDIVIVDLNEKPVAGDLVCAQVYQWDRGKAETVFRFFEPPYLVAAPGLAGSIRALRKPLLVDSDQIIIKGVVIASLRART